MVWSQTPRMTLNCSWSFTYFSQNQPSTNNHSQVELLTIVFIAVKFCPLSLELSSAVISSTSSLSASSSSATTASSSSTFYFKVINILIQSARSVFFWKCQIKVKEGHLHTEQRIWNITSAFWWPALHFLLSFDNLLQILFLLFSLKHLPCNRVVLHLQLPIVRLFCLFESFFGVPVKKKGALNGSKETSLHTNIYPFL